MSLVQKGLTEFNQGLFFEAHETWEEAWNDSWGVEKRALQVLIKISVSLLKWQSGIPGGALKMYEAARRNFAELPDEALGLDMRKIERDFSALLHPLTLDVTTPFPKEVFQLKLP